MRSPRFIREIRAFFEFLGIADETPETAEDILSDTLADLRGLTSLQVSTNKKGCQPHEVNAVLRLPTTRTGPYAQYTYMAKKVDLSTPEAARQGLLSFALAFQGAAEGHHALREGKTKELAAIITCLRDGSTQSPSPV